MPSVSFPRSTAARILVIEPDVGLRYLLVRALEEVRYVVVSTGDLALAREILEAGPPFQLLVTNLMLDIGGHVAYLDALETRFPALPILHLTGPVFQGRGPFTSAGFSISRFIAAVRHCLATGRCDPPPEERRIA